MLSALAVLVVVLRQRRATCRTGRPVGRGNRRFFCLLVSVQMPAQFLERALTQDIGIALARLGTLDDSFGDDSVGEIVCKSEGYASHFERDAQNPLGFRTGIEVAKVRRDGHADSPTGAADIWQKTICAATSLFLSKQ